MPLTTAWRMLRDAQKNGYAVPAFNVENLEMAQGVIAAAADAGSPVILQTTSPTVAYASASLFVGLVEALAREVDIPVCLHLDHATDPQLLRDAIGAGYPSVMMDASRKSFEENLALTREAVQYAAARDVPVEAELGSVGGKEDDVEGASDYTDPQRAREFVRDTGLFSLAVAIGTAHGVYKQTPRLDLERLSAIRAQVEAPLVLHGASGLEDQQVRQCVQKGICKVNFATELRAAYTAAVRKVLAEHPEAIDPKLYGREARLAVECLARHKMDVCGSVQRA